MAICCVFSTQFSILIIVGLIGPNRGHIPEYIGLRLGPRYFQPRSTGWPSIFDWNSYLKKVAATYDLLKFVLGPQQVDLWVRVRGEPFPHIHTYILQDQAGPWCTQLQILDLHVLELDPLNFDLFFLIFHQPKRVLSTRSSKSPELYPIKTCFVFKRVQICNFCLRRARPGIRRPWTCSCSHTYMQCSDPQIHLLWP